MRLAVGSGDRELRILFPERAIETRNEIAGQEWAVGGSAQNELNIGPVGRGPVQRCENAGKRARKIGNAIGDDRQAERRKARGIAIGIEDEPISLRLEQRDHAVENGAAADPAHRFVAATHPPCKAAGEQYAGYR
jgi:hypothetical protein